MSHSPDHEGRAGSSPPRVFDPASRAFALILGIAAIVAGIGMGLWNPLLRRAASVEGAGIDTLFSIALGVATAIFVIVQGALVYSIIRFSQQPGDESDGPPIRGNTTLEVLWTAIPAGIVVFLAIYSYQVLAAIERPQPDALEVEVKGLQYAWEFYYPASGVTSSELHIPVNRQVHLKLRSEEVIHSFWVPAFRIKKDLMPDRVTETYITATRVGIYPIVCAELCGAGHAAMRANLVVESDAEFRNWLAAAAAAKERRAAGTAPAAVAGGREIYTRSGCAACHALTDANAVGQVGPSLDGIGTRAASTVPGQSAEEYIRTSIVKPADFAVGGYPLIMPGNYSATLSEAELDALVEYLLAQK